MREIHSLERLHNRSQQQECNVLTRGARGVVRDSYVEAGMDRKGRRVVVRLDFRAGWLGTGYLGALRDRGCVEFPLSGRGPRKR